MSTNPRPWTAEQLQTHFEYRRVQMRVMQIGSATPRQARAVASMLGEFLPNRKDRLAVTGYMAGREIKSTKELSKAEATLFYRWLDGDPEIVKQECERLLTAALEAEGQLRLFE